jgi:hypothetical protein
MGLEAKVNKIGLQITVGIRGAEKALVDWLLCGSEEWTSGMNVIH